ncbi:hypothetical protein H0H92_002932 [Tricholoma furcatifolium]|nr:hypothetical protein H0H92_002932 [Tricholoma furcatifolium]
MAPGTSGSNADKRKGKEKATDAPPKRTTRFTRQTSTALDLADTAEDATADDGGDTVDYGYSDAEPHAIDSGVLISVQPATSSPQDNEELARVASGTTLETTDDQGYLSPDTEDAIAAAALAGNEVDNVAFTSAYNALVVALSEPLPRAARQNAPGNAATNPLGRLRPRTRDNPSSRLTEARSWQKERLRPHTLGTHTIPPQPQAPIETVPAADQPAPARTFTFTQEQFIAIITAAQAGQLSNLTDPASLTGTGTQAVLHDACSQGIPQGTTLSLFHTSHAHAPADASTSRPAALGGGFRPPTYPSAGNIGSLTNTLLGRLNTACAHVPAKTGPTLCTPFPDASAPSGGPSGFTPLVRKLANPSSAALHALPPTQSVLLSADDRVTPHKVQKILRSGFKEHIPLHHLTNKLMEEATFSTPPPVGGLQISGQTISIGTVSLESAGERLLTPELWIECSGNLVRSIAEHLLAGTDGVCGGPTARVIASHFEHHFATLRNRFDFISHFRHYLEYDIRIRARWVTMSAKLNLTVWQKGIWEGIRDADILRSNDALLSSIASLQNTSSTSARGGNRGGNTQSFRSSTSDRGSSSNKATSSSTAGGSNSAGSSSSTGTSRMSI